MDNTEPHISLITEDALLFSFSDTPDSTLQQRLWTLADWLRDQQTDLFPLQEIVPGPGSLMLQLTPDATQTLASITDRLESLWQSTERVTAPDRQVDIPVHYGGSAGRDLDAVAAAAGLSSAEVIALHSAAEYQVLCLGFQPGFPYLNGLDKRLHTPRRSTPRTRIPAGSVAIGGNQTGIYPADSPGGWHIIGHTSIELFNPRANPPCKLRAGDRIRFIPERQR